MAEGQEEELGLRVEYLSGGEAEGESAREGGGEAARCAA